MARDDRIDVHEKHVRGSSISAAPAAARLPASRSLQTPPLFFAHCTLPLSHYLRHPQYLKTLIREHDVRVGAAVQKYEVAHGVDEFFAFLVEVAKDDLAAQGTDTSGPTTAWQ